MKWTTSWARVASNAASGNGSSSAAALTHVDFREALPGGGDERLRRIDGGHGDRP